MVSDLPSICLTLPDGCVLTVALVGMANDRFGSMFLNGIQVCYVSGSSCNVHPNTTPIEESFYRCMNCALEFHLCITCSGCHFGDWFLGADEGGFQNRCSLSMVRRNLISTAMTSPCRLWNGALTANPASLWAWTPFLLTLPRPHLPRQAVLQLPRLYMNWHDLSRTNVWSLTMPSW